MNVVIAGYGVEGRASYEYWHALGASVSVADERSELSGLPEGVHTILGPSAFDELAGFDVIIRSPGLRPSKVPYGSKVWSATNEFFAKCPAPIIGVTGTKGKGTTASLIASILRAAGKTVHLVGNIGQPALVILPAIQASDVVVYELSSFQLWDAKKSPHIAVVLGIEPDHLDVHSDFEDYLNAKKNIRRHQTMADSCIYHPTNRYAYEIAATAIAGVPASEESIDFAARYAVPDEDQVYVKDDYFCVQDRRICATSNLQLPGAHNLENACAAMSAVSELLFSGISDEQYAEGLRQFTGLPHRLKFVSEKNGVKYYDDSIATTPGSAIAAMRSFDAPKLLILGGSDKGAEYDEVVAVAKETGTKVLAIGQTGGHIYELCQANEVLAEREEGLMPEVVAHAAHQAPAGGVVILSPASASFDQYKSYSDRGDQFIAAVERL